jgi:BASS family bile acid:Na+ symporter
LAAGGNVSYSVSLTASATLLSPLFVPAAFWLFLGKSLTVSPLDVSFKLLYQVVGPVVIGHLLSRRLPHFQKAMHWLGPVIANLAILWIVAAVFAQKRDAITQHASTVGGALLLINVSGYAAGFIGGKALRFSEPMRRALTLEIGMQNAGLGTVLAGQLYPGEPSTMIPPALYTFGCMLTGTMLAQYWRFRPVAETEGKPSTLEGGDE